eukprot:909760-Prorocentrum_minimum.AAC.4
MARLAKTKPYPTRSKVWAKTPGSDSTVGDPDISSRSRVLTSAKGASARQLLPTVQSQKPYSHEWTSVQFQDIVRKVREVYEEASFFKVLTEPTLRNDGAPLTLR